MGIKFKKIDDVIISKKISKSKSYIDDYHAKTLIKDLEKQILIAEKALNEISNNLNKAIYKKIITGEDVEAFLNLSKQTSIQANQFSKLSTSIDYKYYDDLKKYEIENLDKRIAELEKKLKELSK